MQFNFLIVTFVISVSSCTAIRINSKLGFDENSGSSLVKSNQRSYNPTTNEVKIIRDSSDTLDQKEKSCISTGCNVTKIDDKTDEIKTEVIVKVTKNDDNKQKKKIEEQVQDIPVVLGTNGVGSRTIPNIHRGLQYNPSVRRNYGETPQSLVVTNIEEAFPSVNSRSQNNDWFMKKTSTPSYTPSIILKPDNGYRQTENGKVELNVPYFEPANNNHYYGENYPSQVTYYMKKNYGFNPVAFTYKPQSFPSLQDWNKNFKFIPYNQRQDSNCKCTSQNNP